MKAVRIHALGGIDALRHEDCEDPLLEEPADATVKLLAAAVNRVDLVVDCIGGRDWGNSLACLARCGRLVTCGAVAGANPPTDLRRVFWNQLKVCGATHPTRDEFSTAAQVFRVLPSKTDHRHSLFAQGSGTGTPTDGTTAPV